MKLLFFMLCLLHCCDAHAQIVHYDLNRRLEYKVDDEHRTAIFYNNKEVSPVLLASYQQTWEEDFFRFVNWQYKYNGQVYDIQGSVKNEQYFVMGAYSELNKDNIPGSPYQLADQEYLLEGYDPCSMYEQQYGNGSKLRIYVYDRKDGEDYNKPMRQLLQSLNISALELARGQVIVYAELYIDKENALPVFGLLQEHIEYYTSFTINHEDIKATLSGDPEVYKKLHDVRPYPVYCEVIGWNNALDNATTEKLNEFFGDMCNYFELYGHKDPDDFNKFYINEIQRLADHYRKHQQLTMIQADLFRKEAMAHRVSNKKGNWIE